jgi:hypothetical protein
MRDYLENSTLLGQPQTQELIEIKPLANITTQRRESTEVLTQVKQNYAFLLCCTLLYGAITSTIRKAANEAYKCFSGQYNKGHMWRKISFCKLIPGEDK